MERFPERVCSSWKTSSAPTRLLGFVLPLMVVSVLVGSKYSNWRLFPDYYPWAALSSADGTDRVNDTSFVPPEDGGVDLDLRPRAVGSGEREEALSHDHYNLNLSAVPPLDTEAESPITVEKKKESPIITASISNETQALPSNARINRKNSNLVMLEAQLQQARTSIRDARNENRTNDSDYIPSGPMYWNPPAFHRSYLEMEKKFKVFVYEEGEQPIFHNGPCGSIYSMEGTFMSKIESTKFRTRNPEDAHVFFLPFSVAKIVHFINDKNSNDHWLPMKQTVRDFVDLLAGKYIYWNRSRGADHFMLACHDWGPELSKSVPDLFKNSIRALCNANTSEGFQPSKDVSIPEINLGGGLTNGLIGGPSPSKRPVLVFFAGGLHGPIRPIILEHWENKDEDVQIHQYLPKHVSYSEMMRKSRYCLCPSGYEVASPRMVEALYMGCVPVLIKDHYVPPFNDVLNWKSFSVEIPTEEIPNMKKILAGIPTRQYLRMHRRGVQVRQHFEVNLLPKRYDVFHMILHSIWLRRLNTQLHDIEDLQ